MLAHEKRKTFALIMSVTLLCLSIFDWQLGFYTFLKFVIFATALYLAWLSYESKRESWVWTFALIAIIFNPFIPLYFSKDVWKVLDILTAVVLLVSVLKIKRSRALTDKEITVLIAVATIVVACIIVWFVAIFNEPPSNPYNIPNKLYK